MFKMQVCTRHEYILHMLIKTKKITQADIDGAGTSQHGLSSDTMAL